MNRRISAVVYSLIASGLCFGQSGSSIAAATPTALMLASVGSSSADPAAQQKASPADQPAVIIVELSKSLDSRKLTAGNAIEAKVATELRWNGTVIPRGSKVMGHVTESSSRAKGDPASALGIVFDRISLKDGTDLPVKVSIQAVGARPGFGPSESGMGNPSQVSAPGAPGSMGGINPNPVGMGVPQTNFPPHPSAGTQPTPTQGSGQDSAGVTAQSTGVVGLPDLQLEQDSVLASSGQEVKLGSGSRFVLRVQSQ